MISKQAKYYRSKIGLIRTKYKDQIRLSKKRKMNLPEYTLEEFTEWVLNQKNFDKLYDKWILSNYQKDLSPSIDRIDDYKTYSFDNIRLVTFKENRLKYYSDARNGINLKKCKKIIAINLENNSKKIYYSISQASRELNIATGRISAICKGKRNFANNYKFKYA